MNSVNHGEKKWRRKPGSFLVLLLCMLLCLCMVSPVCALEGKAAAEAEETDENADAKEELLEEKDKAKADGDEAVSLNVHFLDVGQGLAVLLESDGNYVMYDGGGRDSSDMVVSYLKDQGVRQLDCVIASHYDEDHLAGLIGVMEAFEVKQILTPDYETDTAIYEAFRTHLADRKIEEVHPEAGDRLSFGSAKIKILGPVRYDHSAGNDNSICAMVTCGAVKFLFSGDAEKEGEDELIKTGSYLRADVLVAGHHGSANSTTAAFLNKVRPSCVVYSCAKDVDGLPSKEVTERLKAMQVEMYRTDEQGTVVASTDGESLKWSTTPSDTWAYKDAVAAETGAAETAAEETAAAEAAAETAAEAGDAAGVTREAADENVHTYILNTSSKKFHYENCSGAAKIADKNRAERTDTRENIMADGYKPCKICNP